MLRFSIFSGTVLLLSVSYTHLVELTRLKQVLDDPDTDSVVELAIHNILGSAAAQSGYDLIEF